MKTIKYLNTIAIGIPLILTILSIIDNGLIILAVYSTMITGAIQVLLGLIILINELRNKYVLLYFSVVIIFFALWYFNVKIIYSDLITFTLFPIPLLLAIYLSVLIYKKEKL